MKNTKVVCIGSITEDQILVPQFNDNQLCEGKIILTEGDKIPTRELFLTGGGGGANVAVGLCRASGAQVILLGAVGQDEYGSRRLRALETEGIDVSHVQELSGKTSISAILIAPSGDRVVFHHGGVGKEFEHIVPATLDTADAICLMHLSAMNGFITESIIQCITEHPRTLFCWNPGRESLEQGVAAFSRVIEHLDLLLVNETEICAFVGIDSPLDALRELYRSGTLRVGQFCAVTAGKNGSYATDGESLTHMPALEYGTRADTLGAGDGFMTGMMYGLLGGRSLPQAQIYGSISAGHVVMRHGAQLGLCSSDTLEQHAQHISLPQRLPLFL